VGQTKVVTKQHHDDKIVDNNHQVLVFSKLFSESENCQFLVFWGNNRHQRTTSSSYFKTLKEPTAL
jgi:hypothetical protein